MLRTQYFDKKYPLLTSSLHYYYSLTFLRVESKDQAYRKFRLERKGQKMRIVEWPPPSVNLKQMSHLVGLLSIIQIISIISKKYGSFETLEEYLEVQKYYGIFGRPTKTESAKKRPVYFKSNAPSSALFLKNLKGQGVWCSYTL